MQEELRVLIDKVKKYYPDVDETRIQRAYEYASRMHGDQRRNSGELYIVHPLQVACILADLQLDLDTILAGLLHDCLEDCEVSQEDIAREFSQNVATLVQGVTNLTRLDFHSKEEQQIESQRKMIMAMAKDIRVVLIKLADRLHNMRTLRYNSRESQIANADETLEIYAPLAHRLGIYSIKWELEDIALRYKDPEGYYELVDKVNMRRDEREALIESIISTLKSKLAEQGIEAQFMGRPKHFYSIYNKMKTQGKTFEELYDLTGVRILVNSVNDCYAALGVVHNTWPFIPNRFKDYIGHKKTNQYQSLHTTLVGEGGQTFEVQIRTHEMHRVAEYGVAAHWKYKEGRSGDDFDQKMAWIRQILELQSDFDDPAEFIDSLKRDVFSEEVFVFTPKGDVRNLPKGATVVDFAYSIHTSIGNRCVGAKVNGKIVPLDYQLVTGDTVMILTTSTEKGPGRNWDKFVALSSTKAKIRAYFKKVDREENTVRGREMLEKEAKRFGMTLGELTKPELVEPLFKKYYPDPRHPGTLESIYADVGFGALSTSRVINALVEEHKRLTGVPKEKPAGLFDAAQESYAQIKKKQDSESAVSKHGVLVQGEANLEVRIAKCCTPVPGDEIMGFITRNRGVTVHKASCLNLRNELAQEPHRAMSVSWDMESTGSYTAEVLVIIYSKSAVISSIMQLLDRLDIQMLGMSFGDMSNPTMSVRLSFTVTDAKQLNMVIQKLRGVSDVIDVVRESQ